jgi:hypothetical protein
MPAPNTRYKILGFKWYAKLIARWQVFYRLIGSQLRTPQHFIVCREAEHRQNIVLHAVVKMVETVVS